MENAILAVDLILLPLMMAALLYFALRLFRHGLARRVVAGPLYRCGATRRFKLRPAQPW